MKKLSFLNKLRKENKLELVEPSPEICESYIAKAQDCLKSAKLLMQNNLYENSVSMSYYAMYNMLVALLFKVGVKCENHTGSVLLLKKLFNNHELYDLIFSAKKERIDKQYYVTSKKYKLTETAAKNLIADAETFLVEIRLVIINIKNVELLNLRKQFGGIL